ncbi:DegV family protein [Bacillus sp. SL00103]
MVDDFNSFTKSGRLNGAQALGSLLKVKPILHFDNKNNVLSLLRSICNNVKKPFHVCLNYFLTKMHPQCGVPMRANTDYMVIEEEVDELIAHLSEKYPHV